MRLKQAPMTDIEGIEGTLRDELIPLEKWRVWMNNAGVDLARSHREHARNKVESGDERWRDNLDLANEIMRKRFKE